MVQQSNQLAERYGHRRIFHKQAESLLTCLELPQEECGQKYAYALLTHGVQATMDLYVPTPPALLLTPEDVMHGSTSGFVP